MWQLTPKNQKFFHATPDSGEKFFSNMQINGVLSLFLDGNGVNDFSLAVDHV